MLDRLSTGLLVIATCLAAAPGRAEGPLRFETDVRPILQRACVECHGDEPEGRLDLRTVAAMLRGGANGPAVARGKPDQSLLVERIEFGEMPPPDTQPPDTQPPDTQPPESKEADSNEADSQQALTSDEVRTIRLWIEGGCRAEEPVADPPPRSWLGDGERRHWAFRPFEPSIAPPAVTQGERVRTPVDAFVQARLEQQGLALSPDADRMRLARRAFVDLVGLPPPPERMDAFVSDDRPDAFERLVDELLASPQFGVRWGRHWLDIVGYTDTISFDDDYGPPIGFVEGKWRYRDYVIDRFNQDHPFRQFIREQLAGDELVDWRNAAEYTPEIIDSLVATGYLRCCEDISKEDPRPFVIWSVLHDSVQQIGTSLLGLTMHCARCHNHKFEPIPQRDYYGLMALLTPALNPADWKDPQQRALPDVSAPGLAEINAHNARIDALVKPLQDRIDAIRARCETELREAHLATVPEPDREALRTALNTGADTRDEAQASLVAKYGEALKVAPQEIDAALTAGERQESDEAARQIAERNSERRGHGWIHAVYDVGPPPATRMFRRGTYLQPRREVPPGFLEALAEDDTGRYLQASTPAGGSGRRLALAHWMTDDESPASALVARVMVNRIWAHLLGEGLVPTTDNLGVSGAEPTHPRLLDWLASEFHRQGSIKRLVRRIVTSTVYRQASFGSRADAERARDVDPSNRLLWRARLRRVEAEVVRDSILAVAGLLDASMGGEPVPLEYRPDGTVLVASQGLPTPTSQFRRSVYLLNRRIYNPSFLSVFDKPIVTGSVCQRDVSAVAQQSLGMLNDAFVVERSKDLAQHIAAAAGPSPDGRIELLFRLTLARDPAPRERDWCREMLSLQSELHRTGDSPDKPERAAAELLALADLCQTVLNATEFLYLE